MILESFLDAFRILINFFFEEVDDDSIFDEMNNGGDFDA